MNSRLKHLGIYALLIAGFAAAITTLLHFGPASHTALIASGHVEAVTYVGGLNMPLAQTLLQLLVIVIAARAVGAWFTKISQRAVIGEMAVGIALGPSLLGAAFPTVQKFIFPAASLGTLSLLSQVGIVLFMFIVGMDLDLGQMKRKAGAAIMISHASTVLSIGTLAATHSFTYVDRLSRREHALNTWILVVESAVMLLGAGALLLHHYLAEQRATDFGAVPQL